MKAKGKVNFGILVGSRGFFNPKLAVEGRKQLLAKLKKEGYGSIILPAGETPNGAVETIEDAVKYAKLFVEKRSELSGIIVSLPNFGDEIGIVNAVKEAGLDVPVMVQACDDFVDKVDIAHRRDSFCGKISVCNNFYQYDIPFTNTTTHTCEINSKEFSSDLAFFAKVCRVVKGLKSARIGQVGTRPGPFQTMRISEKLLQQSGITVVPVDLSEIIFAAMRLDEKASVVKNKIKAIRAYGSIPKSIPDKNIVKQAKLSAALSQWIESNQIDAAGIQCWTSIQENYGCAACASMSMLGESLIPCACEADVGGVTAMYAMTLATGNPSALLDWNNNYGRDRNKCVCTHCSSYPKSFIGGKVEVSNLDVLGASLGEDSCFGGIKGKVKAGAMTFARVDTDDVNGTVRAYMGDGSFTNDPFPMAGGIAVCKINNLQSLMNMICERGFEHHTGMVRDHCADVLEEAFTKYMGWEVYRN